MEGLIRCPYCDSRGTVQNLARLQDDGSVSIQRMWSQKWYEKRPGVFVRPVEYTLVTGTDFEIICGNCKEKVFLRRGGVSSGTIFSHWESRVLGESFSFEIGTNGTHSNTGG